MRFWDSSALVPLLVTQPLSSKTDKWVAEDGELAVWTLTPIELASAVLRLVRDSDSAVLAVGMSDRSGEAVLAVPGIGVSSNPNGGGPVVTTTVETTLTVYFDPATLEKLSHGPEWLPNPDDMLNDLGNVNLKKISRAVKIGRGTQSYFKLPIAL